MNIDIREYLRINPISVHELSLSDQDTDCFIFFPDARDEVGYRAFTQRQMFKALMRSIFGNLVVFDSQGNATIRNTTTTIDDEQFENFVRRGVVNSYMRRTENHIRSLETSIENKIRALRRKGLLKYKGAVELQSNATRRPPLDLGLCGETYRNMSYTEGQIWCRSTSSGIELDGGADEVLAGDQPVAHDHPDTKAEALTLPLTTHTRGGKLVGDYATGSSQLLAQSTGAQYGATVGGYLSPVEGAVGLLTYPLYGQNVLDWRTPEQKHNNVPPCLNIHVRYNPSEVRDLAVRGEASGQMDDLTSYSDAVSRLDKRIASVRQSIAEAQYRQDVVGNLDEFTSENLTTHDCLLRVAMGDKGIPEIYRQTVKMLMDIFAEKTNAELSTDEGTMEELLVPHLDRNLMPVNEFAEWYIRMLEWLKEIAKKTMLVRELMVSVPPLNYVGRIIVSTTDDTEQKVISSYGGRRWRRIENFLRGVQDDDCQNIIGAKWGEEYVCLRESNVPIHAHQTKLSGKPTTNDQVWAAKDKPGEHGTKLVNTNVDEEYEESIGARNAEPNYQMSPLEYAANANGKVTIPHDNMPPNLGVYIWECLEVGDDPGNEPVDENCVVTWLANGGTFPGGAVKVQHICTIGGSHEDPGTPTRSGCSFAGWKGMSGVVETTSTILRRPVIGNETYVAQWKSSSVTVAFDANGGTPILVERRYFVGNTLGELPLAHWGEKTLAGWFTSRSGGTKALPTTKVTGATTYYAQWQEPPEPDKVVTITWDANGGTPATQTWTRKSGIRLGSTPAAAKTGNFLVGWHTDRASGTQVGPDTTTPSVDTTYYAHWQTKSFELVAYANGTSQEAKAAWPDIEDASIEGRAEKNYGTVTYGGRYPAQVVPTATGYTFKNWYLSNAGKHFQDGDNLASRTIDIDAANGSQLRLWAQWRPNTYTVRFDKNGGTGTATMADQDFTYGVYQNLRPNAFSRKYTVTFVFGPGIDNQYRVAEGNFLGWAETSGGQKKYANKERVKNLSTVDGAVKTLYAKWGTGHVVLPGMTIGSRSVVEWTDEGGTTVGTPEQTFTPSEDTTLTAVWVETNYIITEDGIPIVSQKQVWDNLVVEAQQ